MALREYAVRRGLHVSEYGIEDDNDGAKHTCATEQEVYSLLGLDYIEPELRENRGELEAAIAGTLPELVTVDDPRRPALPHDAFGRPGNARADGRGGAGARLLVSRRDGPLGLVRLRQRCPGGRAPRRIEEVRELNKELKGFRVLAGSEVNIQLDGSLDYDDDVLAELDWVVASVHTSFRTGEKQMTKRMTAAMEHPLVDVIGHPTGRKILTREPYAVDIEALIAKAAETGTMLEINAAPDRRDLSDIHARAAAEAGVMIVIDSDAHSPRLASADPLWRRDRAPGLAEARGCREHAAVDEAEEAAKARPLSGRPTYS